MTHAVLKYNLESTNRVTKHSMQKGAEVLSCALQHGNIAVWAKVNVDENEMEEVEFIVAPTGHPIIAGSDKFVGTIMLHDGYLIEHVFIRK